MHTFTYVNKHGTYSNKLYANDGVKGHKQKSQNVHAYSVSHASKSRFVNSFSGVHLSREQV